MTAPARPLLWRAGADQIAHAHRHKLPRTLCGRLALDERHAWPTANVCPTCRELAVAAEVAIARH